ncbi:MAG: hypothetical protein MJZ74_04250 [Muribaculaceae bacterium]|nr:hypothetical protein [Muribaculaceae bacterium]
MKYFSILLAICIAAITFTSCNGDIEEQVFVGLYVLEDSQPSDIGPLTHIQGIRFQVEDSMIVGKFIERSFYKKRFFKDVERDLRETRYKNDTLFFDMANKDGAKQLYATLAHKGDSLIVGTATSKAKTTLGRVDEDNKDINYKLTFTNEPIKYIDTTYTQRFVFYKNISQEYMEPCYEGVSENSYDVAWPDSSNYNLEPFYQEVERSMLADIAPSITTALANFTRLSWHWTQGSINNATGIGLYKTFSSDGYRYRELNPKYCACEQTGSNELHGRYQEKGGVMTYIFNHDHINKFDYSKTFRDKVIMYDCYLGQVIKYEDVFLPQAEAKLIPDVRNSQDANDMLEYFYTTFAHTEAGDPYSDAIALFNRRPRDHFFFSGNGNLSFVFHVAGEEKIVNVPGSRVVSGLTDYGRALLNCAKIKEVYTLPKIPKGTPQKQRHILYFLNNIHTSTGHYAILEEGWMAKHCAPDCQARIEAAMQQEGGWGSAMGLIGGWVWNQRDRVVTEVVSVTHAGGDNYDVKLKLTDQCRKALGMEGDPGFRTIRYNIKLIKGVPVIMYFAWISDFKNIPSQLLTNAQLEDLEDLPEGLVPITAEEVSNISFKPVVDSLAPAQSTFNPDSMRAREPKPRPVQTEPVVVPVDTGRPQAAAPARDPRAVPPPPKRKNNDKVPVPERPGQPKAERTTAQPKQDQVQARPERPGQP